MLGMWFKVVMVSLICCLVCSWCVSLNVEDIVVGLVVYMMLYKCIELKCRCVGLFVMWF